MVLFTRNLEIKNNSWLDPCFTFKNVVSKIYDSWRFVKIQWFENYMLYGGNYLKIPIYLVFTDKRWHMLPHFVHS